MMHRLLIPMVLSITAFTWVADVAALEVNVSSTTGQSVDLTVYPSFIHFTAMATSSGGVAADFSGSPVTNVPNVTVVSNNVFSSFSENYTNGGGNGDISAPDNPYAVNAIYQSSPLASNTRIWNGDTGSSTTLSFNLTLPNTYGSLYVYTAGWNGSSQGQAQLVSSITTNTPESANTTYTDTTPGDNYWGAVFTVIWSNRAIGETMNLQLINIPVNSSGNTGIIAVAVPEPSTYALGGIAMLTMAGAIRRRKATRKS